MDRRTSTGVPATKTSGIRARAALIAVAVLGLLVASACVPVFSNGSSLTARAVAGSATRANLVWSIPSVDATDSLSYYLISVNGTQAATVFDPAGGPASNCTLTGLNPATTYALRVTAVSASGQASSSLGGPLASAGHVDTTFTTPAGAAGSESLGCVDPVNGATDSDGDGLPNWAETNTKVFNSPGDTGTDPNNADTDGDGIKDGDEVLGTNAGLYLPGLGANPLHKNIFLETDWYQTSAHCGTAYSTQPTSATVTRLVTAFTNAPVTNPDGHNGITMVVDAGQGTPFSGGNLIVGTGDLPGEVVSNQSAFNAVKGANFSANRQGYFHYVLMAASWGGSTSSGVAELPGNDFIVALPICYGITSNGSSHDDQVGDTIMHELGHNLGLHHGGNVDTNYKPNYNSVMNYLFQGDGVDTDCNASGDHKLDYSTGVRPTLVESALNEFNGVCGAGTVGLDWNGDVIGETSVAVDINGDGVLGTLTDFNDWSHLSFAGLQQADGRSATSPWIAEQPARPTP